MSPKRRSNKTRDKRVDDRIDFPPIRERRHELLKRIGGCILSFLMGLAVNFAYDAGKHWTVGELPPTAVQTDLSDGYRDEPKCKGFIEVKQGFGAARKS